MNAKKENIEHPHSEDKYVTDYKRIMQSDDNTFLVDIEWTEEGDSFKKFSMYDEHAPLETSDRTTLISEY